jgi:hypothetical protein
MVVIAVFVVLAVLLKEEADGEDSPTVMVADPLLPKPSVDTIWYVALVDGLKGRPCALYQL